MSEEFYITLSSNASANFFPGNTLTHFFNTLPETLDLGTGDWEVGLAECQYPYNWYNLQPGDGDMVLIREEQLEFSTTFTYDLSLPPGRYTTTKGLVNKLNSLIAEAPSGFTGKVWFTNQSPQKKVTLSVKSDSAVGISPKLARMLGLEGQVTDEGRVIFDGLVRKEYISKHVVDLTDGLDNLWVYSDVVAHRIVGDSKVPLLRVLPVPKNSSDQLHHAFENIHYFPVGRRVFNAVEIDIRDTTGRPVPFERGQVIVTLHFRLRQR
ncbi:hypothetical protein BaRGS_00008841 [Batillaria attramentaria]|uniref:Uncharacterized protein n=1 Tax=Batillaria attramentaria TaxID=370345 RepID=A0ABD0LLE5_9CAEN